MQIASLPTLGTGWFCWLALLWSAYQAIAGWTYGLYIIDSVPNTDPGPWRRYGVYGLHHGLWYLACSYAGFVSWSIGVTVAAGVKEWASIGAGLGALLVALGALAVLGVSGALARMLFLGQKLPFPSV